MNHSSNSLDRQSASAVPAAYAADEAAPCVGIITVNWNGWANTLECLEAVFRLKELMGPVVVVDNGSTDGSIEMILAWAAGNLCVVPQNRQPEIERLVIPPVPKPIPARLLDRQLLEADDCVDPECALYVIRNGANLGFAAGNNIGMKLLLRLKRVGLIWFVNNDALPREDALIEIIAAVGSIQEPLICGSTLLEYLEPGTIQALGGRYWPYSGITAQLMSGAPVTSLKGLEQRVLIDYPAGASMLVNRSFIEKYGLMSEDYFLYYEEIDWVLRMGWPRKVYAIPRSMVFHKGGAATAAGRDTADRSLLADYYTLRNRLLVARRVSIGAFFCCAILTPSLVARRVFRRRKGLVFNAFQAVRDGLLGRSGKRRN